MAERGSSNPGLGGNMLAILGGVQSAVGSYYSTLSRRYQLRSQALDLEFQGSIADINARAAELDAAAILDAAQRDTALTTLRFGQASAERRTRTAAGGVQAGVGSAAEVQASIDVAKELDALTISQNAVRSANAVRRRAVNERNRALISRTRADSLRSFSDAVSPELSAFSSLIGSAGRVSQNMLFQQRVRN